MKFKLSKESVKQLRGIVSNEANDFVHYSMYEGDINGYTLLSDL